MNQISDQISATDAKTNFEPRPRSTMPWTMAFLAVVALTTLYGLYQRWDGIAVASGQVHARAFEGRMSSMLITKALELDRTGSIRPDPSQLATFIEDLDKLTATLAGDDALVFKSLADAYREMLLIAEATAASLNLIIDGQFMNNPRLAQDQALLRESIAIVENYRINHAAFLVALTERPHCLEVKLINGGMNKQMVKVCLQEFNKGFNSGHSAQKLEAERVAANLSLLRLIDKHFGHYEIDVAGRIVSFEDREATQTFTHLLRSIESISARQSATLKRGLSSTSRMPR